MMRNKSDRLHFSHEIPLSIKNSDVIIIAVGPQTAKGDANMVYVESVIEAINQNLNDYKVILVLYQ